VSCGAALFNLRVAAAKLGYRCALELLHEESPPDLLARVVLTEEGDTDSAAAGLFAALDKRRTHRGSFANRAVSPELKGRLAAAAEAEGAWLDVPADRLRGELAALVAEGDRAQFADPRWRRELALWMRPRGSGEGLPTARMAGPFVRAAVGRFDFGRRQAKRDAELTREAPLLAVVGTEGDRPADWLRAGQALERLLLTGAMAGLQAGYLNQPCQVVELRPQLGPLITHPGFPQLCLRLGFPAEPGEAASRRPVDAVLE
jgi:hypothetical protein